MSRDAERLAAALRENLRRRKAQSRARAEEPEPPPPRPADAEGAATLPGDGAMD